MVESDTEAAEVREMIGLYRGNQLFRRDSVLGGPEHDRGPMSIVGTDEDDGASSQAEVADPDVGLDRLQQVPEVERTVGVGEGRGDKESGWGGHKRFQLPVRLASSIP